MPVCLWAHKGEAMGLLETDADNVAETIERKWTPSRPGLPESDYEKEIYEFCHKVEPGENFHRQYTIGKSRADIFVKFKHGAKVAIEVKKDLTDRNDYHRLIGQVYEYLTECEVEVVVVLCGKSDPALVKLTKNAIKFLGQYAGRKANFIHKH
jgi:hypothetical protein